MISKKVFLRSLALLIAGLGCTHAQNDFKVKLATIKTEAEAAAVGYAVSFAEELSGFEGFKWGDFPMLNKGYYIDFTPDISLKTGEEDSFSSLNAKLTANVVMFSTTTVPGAGGIRTPDPTRLTWVAPISIGVETDRNYNNVGMLAEAGIVPLKSLGQNQVLGFNPKLGVFIQGGYKAEVDSAATNTTRSASSGDVDESEEGPDDAIARLKASGSFSQIFKTYKGNNDAEYKLEFVADGSVWYDLVNSTEYYSVSGGVKFHLSSEKSLDFIWEKGSGAPNFNEGEQFSAGLTMTF